LGRLDIGFTGSSPFNTAMPQIISRFRKRWPDLKMSLREMSTGEQLESLVAGSVDIAFVRPGGPGESEGVTLQTVLREPLFAVLPADHPLAGEMSLSISALAGQDFILHPRQIGTGLYDKIMSLCARAGFHPNLVLEAHQMSTIVSLAATGLGVSVVPEAMRRIHVDGACFVPLIEADATMILAVAHRTSDLRPTIRHFLDVVKAYRPDDSLSE
jgi:DNA-binding transcriptional LysR family regulator